jgi:hypothetical protein
MSRGWKSVLAVTGLWVMLCELAGPAQAQYAPAGRRGLPLSLGWPPLLLVRQRLERARLVSVRLRLPEWLWLGRRLRLEQLGLARRPRLARLPRLPLSLLTETKK